MVVQTAVRKIKIKVRDGLRKAGKKNWVLPSIPIETTTLGLGGAVTSDASDWKPGAALAPRTSLKNRVAGSGAEENDVQKTGSSKSSE